MLQRRKALIVEDLGVHQAAIKFQLLLYGYDCDIANNGLEGIEKVKRLFYELIFSDIEMPVMNGYEFLTRVKRLNEYQKVPVVMLSSLNKPNDIDRAYKLGASGYIVKPFSNQAVAEALAKIGIQRVKY